MSFLLVSELKDLLQLQCNVCLCLGAWRQQSYATNYINKVLVEEEGGDYNLGN